MNEWKDVNQGNSRKGNGGSVCERGERKGGRIIGHGKLGCQEQAN
jgi:hypothetical protein